MGNDQIDAEKLRFGEHHSGVNDDDVVAVAKRHHVHSEFTETAERNYKKGLQRLAQRIISSSRCMGRVSQSSERPEISDQRSVKKNRILNLIQCFEPPLKGCATAMRMRARRVAAAKEKKNPPPKIPSLVKTQPPMKEPIKPRMISVMQPKPRPRESCPASHPATRPRNSQARRPRGHHSMTTVRC